MNTLLVVDWDVAGRGGNGRGTGTVVGPTGDVDSDGGPLREKTQLQDGLSEVSTHGSVESFQPAALGRGKIGGRLGGAQGGDGLRDLLELPFELAGPRRQRRCRRGFQDRQGVVQELSTPARGFSQPQGMEESQSFRPREMMLRRSSENGVLVSARQRGQLVSQRRADVTASESLLRRVGEVGDKGPALHHPLLLPLQQIGYGGNGQPILLEQRTDDRGFVERVQRASGGVG